MGTKNGDQEKVIMRHVLEVRFKKQFLSFLDFRGRMTDYMIKALNATQLSIGTARFDLADKNTDNIYFFTTANFGFQIEGKESFDEFTLKTSEFLTALKSFPDYNWKDGLVRIGTKTITLYHRKFDNIQTVKKTYKNLILANQLQISELTNSDIIDTAHTFDLKLKNGTANVQTGPVTKKEAIERFFDKKEVSYERFNRDNGFLFSIDLAGNNIENIKDIDQLQEQIILQISEIKSIFEGFKTYFDSEK